MPQLSTCNVFGYRCKTSSCGFSYIYAHNLNNIRNITQETQKQLFRHNSLPLSILATGLCAPHSISGLTGDVRNVSHLKNVTCAGFSSFINDIKPFTRQEDWLVSHDSYCSVFFYILKGHTQSRFIHQNSLA